VRAALAKHSCLAAVVAALPTYVEGDEPGAGDTLVVITPGGGVEGELEGQVQQVQKCAQHGTTQVGCYQVPLAALQTAGSMMHRSSSMNHAMQRCGMT
jgi:hypothetical protein